MKWLPKRWSGDGKVKRGSGMDVARDAEVRERPASLVVPLDRESDAIQPTASIQVANTGPAIVTAPNSVAVTGSVNSLNIAGRPEPRPWPHRVGHVPPRAEAHQTRLQTDLLGRLAAGDGASVLDQAILVGMGGVGKTQIAADHAHTAWDAGELDVLVWITADSRRALVSGLARAGFELCRADPADDEQAALAFLAWLAPAPRPTSGPAEPACRWMVVLDDVADPDDLRGLWPPASPSGRTVVTTRRREAALGGADRSLIDVDPYDPAEALAYLTEALAGHGRAEPAGQLAALASDLGYLPLALAQAAAYVADVQISCAEYRALLADRTTMLRDAAPDRLPDGQLLTVAATWSLSIDHADTLRPVGLARPMLQLVSLLDGHGIPDAVLTSGPVRAHLGRHLAGPGVPNSDRPDPAPVSVQDARMALAALRRLSLIDYAPLVAGATVRAHVLIQHATRDDLEPDRVAPATYAVADALTAVWPDQESDPELPQALRANAAALIKCCEAALIEPDIHPVLVRVGLSLSQSGNVAAAIRHFAWLLGRVAGRLGNDKASVLAVRRHLAMQYGQRGDVGRAIGEMKLLVRDDLRFLGPDDQETLAARHDLIWWQWAEGDRDGAERDLTVLLADRTRVLGPDHLDTLEARHNLYFAWAEGGRAVEALKAYTKLLRVRTGLLGRDHPDTLATRHQIAGLRDRLSPGSEGTLRSMAGVVRDRTRVQGATYPDTMAARQALARMRGAAGDPKAAVDELTVLYEDRVRVQGADHPDTMTTRRILARWTAESGFPDEALAMLEDLVSLHVRVLGRDQPGTLDTRHEIYTIWARTGRVADACKAFEYLVEDRCRVQGASHYDTQRTRQDLDRIRARGRSVL